MKKGFKSFAAILLVFTMFMSLLSIGVMATESITVYTSVVQNGEFVTGKDNRTMAYVPVTVNVQEPTIGNAFTALHETYYENGTSGYETTQMDWGTSVTKFWGVTSSTVSYYNNNSYAMGLTDPVEDRAHLVFWFYQDASSYSDTYTFFDKTTASVACGDALNLTLTQAGYPGNSPLSGAVITVDGAEFSSVITDTDGKASLSFEESGTYTVSAKYADSYIVPPVCIVTVTEEGKTDAEYVSGDKDALSVSYTGGQNIALPKTGKSGKTIIEWTSDSPSVDAYTGTVTIPDEDTLVTLTATIRCNDASDTIVFQLNIPGRLSRAKAAIEAGTLKPIEYTNATDSGFKYDSAADDTNILALAREIIGDDNITVAFAENFTATDIIAADGTITYPTDEAKEITLPLTLTFNDRSEQVTVSAVIPKHAQTKTEAIVAMKAAMTTYMNDPKVLNGNTSLNEVKTTLLLPGGKTSGLYITWASSNENIIKVTGNPSSSSSHPSGGKYEVKINRPDVGKPDATVTLTATLVYKTTSVMCGAGPIPEESARQIAFDIAVPAVTLEEMQAILDGAASDIKITDKNGAVADLANIKDTLYFPSYEGYTTTWSTNLPIAIPAKGYDKSTVTRPVPGDNASGTITLTLTKGETNVSASFNATVPAWTESELDEERAKLQKVADALTFDEIKNKNTDVAAVTSNLYLRQSAKIDGEKVTFNTYNSASCPYKITWTITPAGIITFNNGSGKVTAPLLNTEISLEAEVSLKSSIAGVDSVRKTIELTVQGSRTPNSAESLEALLDGIAAQTTDATNWESFMAMAAYEKVRPSGSKFTDTAKQNMINASIRNISAANPDESAYSKAILDMHSIGINPKELYPVNGNTPVDAVTGLNDVSHSSAIWTAAYTLLSYQQGDYSIGTQETDIVTALLGTQLDNGGWTTQETAEADATGIAILALAAYYNDNANVKTAIDKAILYLSEVQLDNGGFDGTWGENANNSACVIMGLCAMGINPDTDTRFIKNGNSVLDRLLDFALENNSGFGFNVGDTEVNAYASQQGFPALIAAYQVIKNAAAFNVYDFSSNTLSPGRATGTGTVTAPSAPSGDSITVTITIKSDNGYWMNNKSVTVAGTGATVYHALIKALENSGITQVGAASGYVESMTKDGRTLAEFANGANSGWMYKVNGTLPKEGVTECAIDDGDKIVWFYTNDWTTVPGSSFVGTATPPKEDTTEDVKTTIVGDQATVTTTENSIKDAISKAEKENNDSIVISSTDTKDATNITLEIPASAAQSIAEKSDLSLEVETPSGNVSISNETLNSIMQQAGTDENLKVTVEITTADKILESVSEESAKVIAENVEKNTLENAVIVEVNITSGDKYVRSFGGNKLTVDVPVDGKGHEEGKHYKVHIVSSDGKMDTTFGKCVLKGGKLVIKVDTTHLSSFIVTDIETCPFGDVPNHWAYEAVKYVYANSLMQGTDEATFSPNENMTRAMLVTVLYRMENPENISGAHSFDDVPENEWYSDAVCWAAENGIVNGISSTQFAPDIPVSREQIAVILYRYAKQKSLTTSYGKLPEFADSDEISTWAADAVAWAVSCGLMNGTSETTLSPQDIANRAQVATLLMRFCEMKKNPVSSLVSNTADYLIKTVTDPSPGSVGGEWGIIGLARSGVDVPDEYFEKYYSNLCAYVKDCSGILHTRKYTEYSRTVLALTAIDKNPADVSGYDLASPLADYDKVIIQGINGPVWALIALDCGGFLLESDVRNKYIDYILNSEKQGGGWALSSSSTEADVDVTAMVLFALANYRDNKNVSAAVERGIDFLSKMQNDNGGYTNYNSANSESSAQVLTAISTLGISYNDERFVKNGNTLVDNILSFYTAGNGFSHTTETNLMATEQCFYALVAAKRHTNGDSSLFDIK